MRLLIAPDKFKGTFTAAVVCALLSRGVLEARPDWEVDTQPLADGGEGTLDALLAAFGGTRIPVTVRGPLGDPVTEEWALSEDGAALVESARYCGLDRIPVARRDPLRATSYGLGEAIATALDAGARRFLIGLGGVATVDGGAGMARALGFRLEDGEGNELDGSPASLGSLNRVDASMAHPALALSRFTVLCDVRNPLIGPEGAARVFGPQKGADPRAVEELEAALHHLAESMAPLRGMSADALRGLPMGGAAGGLGAGACCFLKGDLQPGAIFLARRLLSPARIDEADVVVTGEGSLDRQTAGGKVVAAVLEAAQASGRPAIVVAGRWDGTLPAPAPRGVVVVGPGPDPRLLTAADLVTLGGRVAEIAAGMANPGGE